MYTSHAYGISSNVKNVGPILGTPQRRCIDLMHKGSPCGSRQHSYLTLTGAADKASNQLSQSRLVCWDTSHTFVHQFWPMYCSIRFLNMGLVSKNIQCSLRSRLQSVVASTFFLHWGMWWSFCRGAAFTVTFFTVAFFDHSVIVPWLASRRFSPALSVPSATSRSKSSV